MICQQPPFPLEFATFGPKILGMTPAEGTPRQTEPSASDARLLEGFRVLLENEFPKKCPGCGREYVTLEEFLQATQSVNGGSGLMDYLSSEAVPRVAVCRNCSCGSTLATFCQDRRDNSPTGRRRRARFQRLLEMMKSRGVSEEVARAELIAFLRGEPV